MQEAILVTSSNKGIAITAPLQFPCDTGGWHRCEDGTEPLRPSFATATIGVFSRPLTLKYVEVPGRGEAHVHTSGRQLVDACYIMLYIHTYIYIYMCYIYIFIYISVYETINNNTLVSSIIMQGFAV